MLLAQYDTHPQNVIYNQYHGNWGNYPWLPSGNIIAGDMQNGLFMLKLGSSSVGTSSPEKELAVEITPNPAHDRLNIRLQETDASGEWSWKLHDLAGKVIISGSERASATTLTTTGLPQGLYFVEIRNAEGRSTLQKVVIE